MLLTLFCVLLYPTTLGQIISVDMVHISLVFVSICYVEMCWHMTAQQCSGWSSDVVGMLAYCSCDPMEGAMQLWCSFIAVVMQAHCSCHVLFIFCIIIPLPDNKFAWLGFRYIAVVVQLMEQCNYNKVSLWLWSRHFALMRN